MRGIPSSFLFIIGALVFFIELISYFGIWQLIKSHSKRLIIYLTSLYVLISLLTSGLLIYSFANPEVIRQARSYTFFYFVISVTFLNLFPKFIFSLLTLFSFLLRWVAGKRMQLILLTGSFVICLRFFWQYSLWHFLGPLYDQR